MIELKKNHRLNRSYPATLFAVLFVMVLFSLLSPDLNAAAWTQVNRQPGGTFKDIIYGGGVFCAVGDVGLVRTSPDGNTWTNRNSGTTYNIYGVTYGGGQFVAVGYHGIILTSPNGSTWTTRAPYTKNGDSFTCVAYNGTDLYVAAGVAGRVATSPDGITWTDVNTGIGSQFSGLCWGNGKFIGAASAGAIFYSSNGTSWTKAASGVGNSINFYSAIYAGGKYLVGGKDGTCVTSTNGTSWTKVSTGTTNYFMDLAYTDTNYVACGNSDGYACSMALVSSNSTSWVRDKTPDFSTLTGVAAGGGVVVAVGSRRLIIRNTYAGIGDGAACSVIAPPPPSGDTITVTSPNGGESWAVSETHNITWTGSKKYDSIDIEYYNGSAWVVVVSGTADDGSYAWTIPNTITNKARIWMKGWKGDGNAVDYSNSTFSIVSAAQAAAQVTLLTPNGGESLAGGSVKIIKWSSAGTIDSVDIEYTTDGGKNWNILVTGTENDGAYSWTLPNTNTNTARLWMKGWGPQGNDTDYSDSYFSISSSSSLTVSSPNGGESWDVGSSHNITWTTSGYVGNVKIEYSTDTGSSWNSITSSTTNDGSSPWTVPNALSETCLVRVSEVSGGQVSDISNSVFTIAGFPELQVDRSSMTFGAIANASAPSAQTFMVTNGGGGALDWSIASSQTWLSASPSSSNCEEVVSVMVDTSGMGAGTYNGQLTVTDTVASGSPQVVDVTLVIINSNQDNPPFGLMATPADGITAGGSIAVTGWALDDVEVVSVKIYREVAGELSYIGDAVFVEGARADVEAAYPGYPLNTRAGWGYMLLTNFLPDGPLVLKAIAKDSTGFVTTLGTKSITVDNANAIKPFGAIDSPAQGGDASGNSYRNNGWALTPLPNTVPLDGSTINVYIDSVPVGKATYNLYRSDIAGLFPGYNNTDGSWGYFDFDTTAYANGVHTIQWTVQDNAGNTDGIGSRYFNIANLSGADCGQSDSSAASAASMAVKARPAGPSMVKLKKHLPLIPIDYAEPILVKTGYDETAPAQALFPGETGKLELETKELQWIRLSLGDCIDHNRAYSGYMMVNGQLRRLPPGSTLNRNGSFSWQLSAGFVGEYQLVFFITENGVTRKKEIKVNILPGSN
jgi:hypothetical protein